MKAKLLLICSLAVNAGLAAVWMNSRPAPPVSQPTEKVDTAAEGKIKTIRAIKAKNVSTTHEKSLDWSAVESADYRAYIDNLRSIGCPEETIHDIIIADINKLYAPKIAALYPSPMDFKFWESNNRSNRKDEREREEKRHALEKEKRDLIKELLGVDYEVEIARWSGKPDEDAWRWGFLSPEKQAQIKELSDKYREMERGIFNSGGGWSPENRAKFAAMRAEREAKMAEILNPTEFEEYQMRSSWTARSMRESLGTFEPNEEEFRKIFQLRKGFDDQFAFTRDNPDEIVRKQREVAQQELEEKMRGVLGDERFNDYKLSQDDHYRDIYDFAQRNNLPNAKQTAATLYDVRTAVDDQRHTIERDQNLTVDQRRDALRNLWTQTQATLAPTMGDDLWKQLQGERWIARLTQTDSNHDGGGRRYDGRGPR